MRRLIFNADDFGLTAGVNRSIMEAHTQGVLTSATIMAHAPATLGAEQLARAHPQLGVGCHIVLINGTPLTDPAKLTSLIPRGHASFPSGIGAFAARALAGRLKLEQIELEAVAQISKLQAAGLSLSHCDTHKHAHMFPAVLTGLLRAARACGIRAVRNPFEPTQSLSITFQRRNGRKRALQTRLLRLWRAQFLEQVRRAGLRTTDGTIGVAATGLLDGDLFRELLARVPEGTWEFVTHPGYSDTDLQSAGTRLLASRETELRLLTSLDTRAQLKQAGIKLISYRDL